MIIDRQQQRRRVSRERVIVELPMLDGCVHGICSPVAIFFLEGRTVGRYSHVDGHVIGGACTSLPPSFALHIARDVESILKVAGVCFAQSQGGIELFHVTAEP